MLCPATMVPASPNIVVPTKTLPSKLIANGGTPPLFNDSWLKYIPLIGKPLVAGMNASRYTTTLEQAADFIAGDLEEAESRWIGTTVGIIDAPK